MSDELTGLPNRAAWAAALEVAAQRATHENVETAVVFIDLDGFKQVNDTHGHDVGDAVLCEFAERLRACVGGDDVAARLSGDEFVVLLQSRGDIATSAERRARAITSAMQPSFAIGALQLSISGSIGVAVQRDGCDGARLMREADEAMYAAKRERRALASRHHGSGRGTGLSRSHGLNGGGCAMEYRSRSEPFSRVVRRPFGGLRYDGVERGWPAPAGRRGRIPASALPVAIAAGPGRGNRRAGRLGRSRTQAHRRRAGD
ncbi:diguanylate cyclase [Lysobacter sp. HA18]